MRESKSVISLNAVSSYISPLPFLSFTTNRKCLVGKENQGKTLLLLSFFKNLPLNQFYSLMEIVV